jgi:hypothetical protein
MSNFFDLQFEIYYSLIDASSTHPPPEPKAFLTLPQILTKVLVSVIDRSHSLPKKMGIMQTMRLGR